MEKFHWFSSVVLLITTIACFTSFRSVIMNTFAGVLLGSFFISYGMTVLLLRKQVRQIWIFASAGIKTFVGIVLLFANMYKP